MFDEQSSALEAIEVLLNIYISMHWKSASLMNALILDYSYSSDLHSKVLIHSARNRSPQICAVR
jgi:hypothetical protein